MIELVIEQRRRNLGGSFEVGRVLPFAKRRMVGPSFSSTISGRSTSPVALTAALMFDRIRILGFPRSPICSLARSCTATAWPVSRRSVPRRSTG